MGAESMDLPALFMPAGPMLRGNFAGKVLGSGSDTWKYWADLRAGLITQQEWKGGGGRHCPVGGALHDDGYRVDDDQRGGGVGCDAAGRGVDPGRGFQACGDGGAHRSADRGDGVEDVKLSDILTRTA